MNRYYDESSFQFAIDLLETDPFHAKLRFQDYLERYPKDYYARAYYALLLTRICQFEEALMEYEYIRLKSQNDHFYIRNAKDLRGFHYIMTIVKLKILASQEKYEEMFKFLQENAYKVNPSDIKYISYYCRIKLGIIDDNIENSSYRFLQSYNYSEELFREHIKKHLKEYSEDDETVSESIFNEEFPIDKVIVETKKYIPSDKKLFPGYFDNAYFFKYDNCGKVNNNSTDYFTIITFQNTDNYITMCPDIRCKKLPYVDLNYLKDLEDDQVKVKRLSQIEKFNQRFHRK